MTPQEDLQFIEHIIKDSQYRTVADYQAFAAIDQSIKRLAAFIRNSAKADANVTVMEE